VLRNPQDLSKGCLCINKPSSESSVSYVVHIPFENFPILRMTGTGQSVQSMEFAEGSLQEDGKGAAVDGQAPSAVIS
jgi:hypothetical protein